MTLTMLTPILILEMLLCVFAFGLKGYRSGLMRSLIDFAVLIASAFFGVGISLLLAAAVDGAFLSIVENTGAVEGAFSALGPFSEIVSISVSMLSSLVIFLPTMLLVYGIGTFVVRMVFRSKVKGEKAEAKEYVSEDAPFYVKKDKQIGLGVGVMSGLFLAVVLASPLTGALRCTSDIIDVADSFMGEEGAELPAEMIDIEDYSSDFMVTAVDACGGGMWFDMATTTYVYDGFTNISRELKIFKDLGADGITEVVEDVQKMDANSISRLDDFLSIAEKSPLLRLVMTVGVTEMCDAWLDGDSFMGVERPSIASNSVVIRFIDEVLYVMSMTTIKTVSDDLHSLVKICTILMEFEPTLSSGNYEDIAAVLSEGTLKRRLTAELNSNPRMRTLHDAIDDIVMQAFAEEISDFGKYTEEDKEKLCRDLADILTDASGVPGSAKIKTVSGDISSALSDYGIEVPDDVTDSIASMLISGVPSEDGIVSDSAVREYIDAFLKNAG